MSTDSYNITGSISFAMNSSNTGQIIPVLVLNNLPTNNVSVNIFIKNLKAFAKISSLPPIKLPNIELTDSETEKLYKVLDVEWTSPRKQLNIYYSLDSTTWNLIGSLSLLNPSGYPYRIYNLLDFLTDTGIAAELGNAGNVGVQIQDIGYGGLSGNDSVTIFGSYVIEVVTDNTVKTFQNLNISVNNQSQPVSLQSNPKYLLFENVGNNPVWINFGQAAVVGQGISLITNGSSYELPFKYGGGTITCISSDNSQLSVIAGY